MISPEKLKQIEEFVKENMSEREWIHTRQIRPIAKELAEKEGADKEVVDVAVLFHDIGKGSKNHELKSERIAREVMAGDFLKKENIDDNFIQGVCDAVKRHAGPWKGKSEMLKTIEDKVVFDADMIQQRGPFGIAKQLDDFKELDFVERVKRARDQLRRAQELVMTKHGKEMVEKSMKYVEDFFEEVLR